MFTPTPPTTKLCALPILRCTGAGTLDAILVCHSYTGVLTHWIGEETTLHTQSGPCAGCDANQAPRWQGFVIVQSTQSGTHRLLQFTPPVAKTLDGYQRKQYGLSGLTVRLTRAGRERNSPLCAEITDRVQLTPHFSVEQLEEAVSRLFRSNFPLFDALKKSIGCLPVD